MVVKPRIKACRLDLEAPKRQRLISMHVGFGKISISKKIEMKITDFSLFLSLTLLLIDKGVYRNWHNILNFHYCYS